jgi:hypothetical protein
MLSVASVDPGGRLNWLTQAHVGEITIGARCSQPDWLVSRDPRG